MALPTSTEDVSEIAKVLHEHECTFGMRSGAHSAWKGSNGVDDGVTVDFGWLNSTTYDAETKIASTHAGSDWGHSYSALQEHGVINVGGRASVVGVGGFTTGGGVSRAFHQTYTG
jgi:FAD/FMN-containing dehydrogenase